MLDLANASREELLATIAAMQKASTAKLTMKVSEKGALSLCGLQRFPVTLYASQWLRVLDQAALIRDFIKANASTLASKQAA